MVNNDFLILFLGDLGDIGDLVDILRWSIVSVLDGIVSTIILGLPIALELKDSDSLFVI